MAASEAAIPLDNKALVAAGLAGGMEMAFWGNREALGEEPDYRCVGFTVHAGGEVLQSLAASPSPSSRS